MLAYALGRTGDEVVPVRTWGTYGAWESFMGIRIVTVSSLGGKYSPVCGYCCLAEQCSDAMGFLGIERHNVFTCPYRILQNVRDDVSWKPDLTFLIRRLR